MPHIYEALCAICIHKPLHRLITLSLLWSICQFVRPPILSPEFLFGVPMTTSYDILSWWPVLADHMISDQLAIIPGNTPNITTNFS